MTYRSCNTGNVIKRWPGAPPNRQFLMVDLLRRSGYLGMSDDFPTRATARDCRSIALGLERMSRVEAFRHFIQHRELYGGEFTMDELLKWIVDLVRYFRRLQGFERVDD